MAYNPYNGNGKECNCSGGGGTPADYNELKQQVENNTQAINTLQRVIARLDNNINSINQSLVNFNETLSSVNIKINKLSDCTGCDISFEYIDLLQNQAIAPVERGVGLHTGLTLDGNAIFIVDGCVSPKYPADQVCLIGARNGTSTTERTCINLLPTSKQIQSQWASNKYKVLSEKKFSFTNFFRIVSNKNVTTINQNNNVERIENGLFVGTNENVGIYLFNQSANNTDYYPPAIKYAEINHNGVRYIFEPKIKRNLNTNEESIVILKNGQEMDLGNITFEIINL